MKILIKILCFLLICLHGFSQHKKIYVEKQGDNGKYLNGADFSYSPGDTLVLKAAQNPYSYFALENFHGNADNYVVIINEGAQVQFTNGIAITNCSFLKVQGTGSADKYGFKIEDPASNGVAIDINGRSKNIEVNNVYINKKTYGFWVKQEASCIDSLQYPNWVINNIFIHDNKIENVNQEGMYLGSTGPNGNRPITCNGISISPVPLRLGDIKVYKNIIDNSGRSGIQLSGADSGVNEIYENNILNAGLELNSVQGNGISLGGFTHANVYNNVIKNTYGPGIFCVGAGLIIIQNNTIDSSGFLQQKKIDGMPGIMVDTRPTAPVDSSLLHIINNKIGANTDYGIRFYKTYNTYKKGNIIQGNTGTVNVDKAINWNGAKEMSFSIKPIFIIIVLVIFIILFFAFRYKNKTAQKS
ncbi:MAG: right-handed parallel beta-helix repeat-containing protein [Chitinophagaceae bacterium]